MYIFMKLFTVESRLRYNREIPNSFTMFIGLKIRSLSNRTASHMVKSWGKKEEMGQRERHRDQWVMYNNIRCTDVKISTSFILII